MDVLTQQQAPAAGTTGPSGRHTSSRGARRWESDQTFTDVKENRIESADVTDGNWYIIIRGDYTGRVEGSIYDLTNPQEPEPVELTPKWEKCKVPETSASSTSARVRAWRTLLACMRHWTPHERYVRLQRAPACAALRLCAPRLLKCVWNRPPSDVVLQHTICCARGLCVARIYWDA
jgi:hypothetical protein